VKSRRRCPDKMSKVLLESVIFILKKKK